MIDTDFAKTNPGVVRAVLDINFLDNSHKVSVSGLAYEGMISVMIDNFKRLRSPKYADEDNQKVLEALENVLTAMRRRTLRRDE